ncbi:S-layer homology domain-containing protein [Paenibacillus sp. KN14-4R]|uniref:S-layer homology domain-containing protein n=1 Tax=Paenibacillus sp. KN14-4R TaxID=3445773 RepID=UPI003FA15100
MSFKKMVILSTVLALTMVSPTFVTAAEGESAKFKDVSKDYWGATNIEWASDQGIIYGYPDGTFKPDEPVTQTEFVAMLVRAYVNKDQLPKNEGYWGAPYYQYAFDMGWGGSIINPPGGDYRTGKNYDVIETRGYVAKVITNVSGRNYNFEGSIQYLLDSGLSKGKTAPTVEGYGSRDPLTRAESVTFIKKVKEKLDLLYPSPFYERTYDQATLKLTPFEVFPLEMTVPSSEDRFSKLVLTKPTTGYFKTAEASYKVEGTVSPAIGSSLRIMLEKWDKGFFKPVTTVSAKIQQEKITETLNLPEVGVYRVKVYSDNEHKDGSKIDGGIMLTQFYVEYKAK